MSGETILISLTLPLPMFVCVFVYAKFKPLRVAIYKVGSLRVTLTIQLTDLPNCRCSVDVIMRFVKADSYL